MLDVLVKEICLDIANTVQTPAAHDAVSENPKPQEEEQFNRYRSHVAGCLFLSQDRADITYHTAWLAEIEEACPRRPVFDT